MILKTVSETNGKTKSIHKASCPASTPFPDHLTGSSASKLSQQRAGGGREDR